MKLFRLALFLVSAQAFANLCPAYLAQEDGVPIGVRRIESMWGMPVEVIDVSQFLRERSTAAMHGLKVFRFSDVFSKTPMFLGFGRPNMYTAIPVESSENEEVLLYAAKSARRAPSALNDSRGWAQSGVLVVPRLSPEAIERTLVSARKHVGSRSWTCVNDNCKVLADAGFTVGGESPDTYYFPMPLLQDLLRYGLEFDGQPVEFDVVRTTGGFLEDVRHSTTRAVALTPCRHADRACGENRFVVGVKRFGRWTQSFFFSSTTTAPPPPEEMVTRLPAAPDLRTFDVAVSEPTTVGTLLRVLWGPHALFGIPLDSPQVNATLPTVMKAFPQEKPSLLTRLKKNILFAPPVVRFMRSQIASRYRTFQAMSEKTVYDMFRTDTEGFPNKYNLVITSTEALITKNNIRMGVVDWILSKHVLVSGYSQDVRFAGEVWKTPDGTIWVSRNSGTYRPTREQLEAAVAILRTLFPNVRIEAAPDTI